MTVIKSGLSVVINSNPTLKSAPSDRWKAPSARPLAPPHLPITMEPGRVRTAYLFGFNSTVKFENVRAAYATVLMHDFWLHVIIDLFFVTVIANCSFTDSCSIKHTDYQ
jgi:hypothetical protein